MDCDHSQLMVCKTCARVWCVPAIVGKARVFHRHCGQPLELLLSREDCMHATRGTVSFFRDANRLEVQPDVERGGF